MEYGTYLGAQEFNPTNCSASTRDMGRKHTDCGVKMAKKKKHTSIHTYGRWKIIQNEKTLLTSNFVGEGVGEGVGDVAFLDSCVSSANKRHRLFETN